MASIGTAARGSGPEEAAVQRVGPRHRRPALGVLLTGRPDPRQSMVEQFLAHSRDRGLPLSELYAAYKGDDPKAAALILPNAGRSGMLFTNPVTETHQTELTARVIHAACQAQDRQAMNLVQSLTDPDQLLNQRSLEAAQFRRLAVLGYRQRPATLPPEPLQLSDPAIAYVHWAQEHRELFARAIEATYEDTSDCPGLVGLRRMDDIIAGHMATGRFDPRLWFAFHKRGEPVGVMLLSQMLQQPGYELVYLGIAPPFRGMGLARQMLRHGFGVVSSRARHQHSDNAQLHLAVDENNAAARKLYDDFGFTLSTRKVAMIRPLA